MVTNFDFEYANALKKYDEAKTIEEKIKAMEYMISAAPSHKGAENLRADLTKRLTKLKAKLDSQKVVSGSKSLKFTKEGSATCVLLGLPNSGKSTFLSKVTNATPKISNYNFTTKVPEIGVMNYNGAKIQIVELPAIVEDSYKGKARGKEILSLARNGDLIILICLGNLDYVKYSLSILKNELVKSGIIINKTKPNISLKKTSNPGVELVGIQNIIDGKDKLLNLLEQNNISHIILRIDEKTNSKDVFEALDITKNYKKIIGIWLDGKEDFKYENINVFAFNDKIYDKIYSSLDLVIIYTRKPGEKDIDNIPVALKKNSTIENLCSFLHKDFLSKFKFAKVWGSSKYPGQQVPLNYILKDKDIVELYIKS